MNTVIRADDLPPDERAAYWRHIMSDTFAPVAIESIAAEPFTGTIEATTVGQLMIADVRSAGQEIHRRPRQIADSDNAYFQIALVAAGRGRVTQDGRRSELVPGDLAVYETTRPFEWRFGGAWRSWGFTFPADVIALSEDERRALTARRMDGNTGLTGVVSRFLLDLARHAEDIPVNGSDQVVADASDLIITLLSQTSGYLEGDSVKGATHRSLTNRAKGYIQERLWDPDLSPAEIAAAVGISKRYLHRLFESQQHTVALYVRSLRLEQVREQLADPRHAHQSVAALAHNNGFRDLSGFNRAFRATYGTSPSELRHP